MDKNSTAFNKELDRNKSDIAQLIESQEELKQDLKSDDKKAKNFNYKNLK